MINSYTKEYLLELYNTQNIMLEGNILKIIKKKIEEDGDNDLVFKEYIEDCINTDRDKRKMRLEITKEVQKQNKELQLAKEEIERINDELTMFSRASTLLCPAAYSGVFFCIKYKKI